MLLKLPPIAKIGDALELVSSPALLIDLDAFGFNLAQMADYSRQHNIALRPHAKAHKSTAIAKAQIASGAVGICCQKLSEAYPFANEGIKSIHISNQFVGAAKVAMAIELARHVNLSVCVDHVEQIVPLGIAAKEAGVRIAVLPEVDVGQGRCGVSNTDDLVGLIDVIASHDALHFGGLQAYHGGAQHIGQWDQRMLAARQSAEATVGYVKHLSARGIQCDVVTGGGTGTAEFDATSGIYTEIQPGSYVFMDRSYGSNEWRGALQFKHSLFIVSTIMSTAKIGKIVCDVGLKSVAVDSGMPFVTSQGGSSSLNYIAANDEHGIIEVLGDDVRDRMGERLLLVPGHCDPTANLYSQYVGFRKNKVECIWDIEARGLSQ